ncbi:MAG: PQQ-binding-like beta-propeller repeat protein, partial [Gammaproteobacteria bacterium]
MDRNRTLLLFFLATWGFCGAVNAQSRVMHVFSAETLVKPPAVGWLTNGGNIYNQRYSPLTEINRDNVAGLKPVWHINLDGSGVGAEYSAEAQPLVHEGVIFLITGANDVFAISVETGEQIWKYEANLDRTISTVCCGWTSRGVGLGEQKIFVGQLDGRLLALNEKTGEVV